MPPRKMPFARSAKALAAHARAIRIARAQERSKYYKTAAAVRKGDVNTAMKIGVFIDPGPKWKPDISSASFQNIVRKHTLLTSERLRKADLEATQAMTHDASQRHDDNVNEEDVPQAINVAQGLRDDVSASMNNDVSAARNVMAKRALLESIVEDNPSKRLRTE